MFATSRDAIKLKKGERGFYNVEEKVQATYARPYI